MYCVYFAENDNVMIEAMSVKQQISAKRFKLSEVEKNSQLEIQADFVKFGYNIGNKYNNS